MATLPKAPTANWVQTTLNGTITSDAATITVNSATNLQYPGYVVIDRQDSAGNNTASAREVVYYTGITGSNLTGCTRGADGSTQRSHADGALVETCMVAGMYEALRTAYSTNFTADGVLNAIISPVSIARAEITNTVIAGTASIQTLNIEKSLILGTASISGLGLNPVFNFVGSLSGASTLIMTPLSMPRIGTWKAVSVITRTVASGVSAIIDVNKNGTSIFDAGTRPSIPGGGTYVSTASIKTANFSAGDRISWDYDSTEGHITDFSVMLVGV